MTGLGRSGRRPSTPLPKTSTDKIQKYILRERAAGDEGHDEICGSLAPRDRKEAAS